MTARTWIRPRHRIIATALAALLAAPGAHAQSLSARQTADSLHRALNRLPYYGVFDFLAFNIDKGTVTLLGFTYSGTLKADAERTARRVAGVDEVANRLEVLPASINDDRIRRATFHNIYTDSVLSRYASGGERMARDEALEFGRYPGQQPFGTYPIHIIVKHGRTTLLGTVDNAADRQIAGFRAREVDGVFAVNNELVLASDDRR
jgi:hypothetical protein